MTNSAIVLSNLITDTLDGDWGRGDKTAGDTACRVIRGADFPSVRLGTFSDVPIRYLSQSSLERRTLRPNDIIIETAGGTHGRPTGRTILVTERLYKASDMPLTCASFCRFLRVDSSIADPAFVFWYLQYLYTKGEMWKHQVQHTGLARFQYTRFAGSVDISLPPAPIQRAIANILSALDDTITLNYQMSKTLEAIGRAIFKHWFNDWEFPNAEGHPYKSSGGEIVYNEQLGNAIPKGWRIGRLEEFIDLDKGLSYKGEFLSDDGIPMVNLGTIGAEAGFIQEGLKHYVGEYKEKQLVNVGDIVIANTDLTQRREVLGSPVIVPPYLESEKSLFTHHIFAVRNKSHLPISFIYHLLQTTQYKNRVRGFATGTTVLSLPKDAILDFIFAVPNEEALKKFDVLYSLLFQKANSSVVQNRHLAQIRDSLLPKLMLGRISPP